MRISHRGARAFTYVLSIVTTIVLFVVNIIGFVDTETGSAFGCGHSWPLCNGQLIPTVWGLHTLIEFAHRGVVGLATVLLLATSVMAWRLYGKWPYIRTLILVSVGFVFVQAILGAIGVKTNDPAWFIAIHFGVSLLAFNGVFLLCLRIRQVEQVISERTTAKIFGGFASLRFRFLTGFSIVYLYIQMYYGAYVTSTGKGHEFRGWPFPTETFAQHPNAFVVDVIHRSFALGITLISITLIAFAWELRKKRRDLYMGAVMTLILVLAQAVSGGVMLWSEFALYAFLLHVTFVSFLFATLCYLWLQTSKVKQVS